MKPIRVPRELDSHPRFLLWRANLVFVWLTVTAMGAFLEEMLYGSLLGAFLAWRWHRKTLEEGRGFLRALSYWHLGDAGLKRLPSSARRRTVG